MIGKTPIFKIDYAYRPICAYSNVGDISYLKYEFSSRSIKDMTRKKCISKHELDNEDDLSGISIL